MMGRRPAIILIRTASGAKTSTMIRATIHAIGTASAFKITLRLIKGSGLTLQIGACHLRPSLSAWFGAIVLKAPSLPQKLNK
jgi:hypothetical protein